MIKLTFNGADLMFVSDIKRVVEQVSRDRGIDREVLIKALEEALRSAARKKFGNKLDIEVQYNDESGEIEVFQFVEVAEEVTEPAVQISLVEGRKLDPECEVGDSLGTKMDATHLRPYRRAVGQTGHHPKNEGRRKRCCLCQLH